MPRRSALTTLALLAASCAVPAPGGGGAAEPPAGRGGADEAALAAFDAEEETSPTERGACAATPPAAEGLPGAEDLGAIEDGGEDDGEVDDEVDDGEVDDGVELPPVEEAADRPPHPFADLSDEELEAMLLEDPESLGSMSLGRTSGGALRNPVKMPEGPGWEVVDPPHSYGTKETVEAIETAIAAVEARFPGSPKLHIGDLSRKNGGRLPPHVSHQAGRDVDLGFYYKTDCHWYTRANGENFDAARTWTLVRALITETDVELILVDRRVQQMLRSYAVSEGEDPGWLAWVFNGRGRGGALIRHARGHATHLHVRFYSPIAQETGRRVYPLLVKHRMLEPPSSYVSHRARKGQTLRWLARRYGTTERAIRRANGLRSSRIREGRTYKIPRRGHVIPETGPVVVPPRRLPPPPRAASGGGATDLGVAPSGP